MALRDAGAEVDLPGAAAQRRPRSSQAAIDDDVDVIGDLRAVRRAPAAGRRAAGTHAPSSASTRRSCWAARSPPPTCTALIATSAWRPSTPSAPACPMSSTACWPRGARERVESMTTRDRSDGHDRRRASRCGRSTRPPTSSGGADGLAERLGSPGEPPFTRGPVPIDVPRPALDDAAVRRVRLAGGGERAVPLPARSRPDGAVGGVRPADAARVRLRPPDGARRGRPGRRRDRHRRRHGRPVRRAAAGRASR